MENNFPWQPRWIPFYEENFDMPFCIPIVPIKLPLNTGINLSKIGESKSIA